MGNHQQMCVYMRIEADVVKLGFILLNKSIPHTEETFIDFHLHFNFQHFDLLNSVTAKNSNKTHNNKVFKA